MKKFILLTFLVCSSFAVFSQGTYSWTASSGNKTKADSIIGKWKYMGAMKSNPVYKADAALYHPSLTTPKFEFLEFKAKKGCNYNEKGKAQVNTTYTISKDTVIVDKIKYQIKAVDKKNLTLYRSLYVVLVNEKGKMERVDEEQLSFIKVQ